MHVDKYLETAVPRTEGSCQQTRWSRCIQCQRAHSPVPCCTAHWPPHCSMGLYLAAVTPNKVWEKAHWSFWQLPSWSSGSWHFLPRRDAAVNLVHWQWGLTWQPGQRKRAPPTQPPGFSLLLLYCVGRKQHPGIERTLSQAMRAASCLHLVQAGM